ncbi:WXG100 family type VII secretion target, partial [Saccharopolyspora hirsuta]|uniref:WXG100 family type VII secretion target n=1 Tax=Saccharopolyspora hirsuta TaxID=1837 RepID=UPI003319C786
MADEDELPNVSRGDDGVFAKRDGQSENEDFYSWDWKTIKASITGGAAVAGDQSTRLLDLVDPQTLRVASTYFDHAEKTMENVATSLRQHAEALAGEDGAWQGPAAKQFLAKMQTFAQHLEANAEVLRGQDGTGDNSNVRIKLYDNGNWLAWAQNAVNTIDTHYAAVAKARGVGTTDDGLVTVSEDPEVVEAMTTAMRNVLIQLSGNYKWHVPDPGSVQVAPTDGADTEKPPDLDPPPVDGPPEVEGPPPVDGPPEVEGPPPVDGPPEVEGPPPVDGPPEVEGPPPVDGPP